VRQSDNAHSCINEFVQAVPVNCTFLDNGKMNPAFAASSYGLIIKSTETDRKQQDQTV
jgi:hypothetical protein